MCPGPCGARRSAQMNWAPRVVVADVGQQAAGAPHLGRPARHSRARRSSAAAGLDGVDGAALVPRSRRRSGGPRRRRPAATGRTTSAISPSTRSVTTAAPYSPRCGPSPTARSRRARGSHRPAAPPVSRAFGIQPRPIRPPRAAAGEPGDHQRRSQPRSLFAAEVVGGQHDRRSPGRRRARRAPPTEAAGGPGRDVGEEDEVTRHRGSGSATRTPPPRGRPTTPPTRGTPG